MKRLTLWALALLIAAPAFAQTPQIQRARLALAFDLDGEGADVDQVIEAVAIIDDGSVSGTDYTIAAQPDVCRLLDLTIVDTDLSAGSITVTGTDCFGDPLVSAFAFTAGDDTGVQTLTVSSGSASGAYYASVTEVATGTMTGESDETFALGYSTGSTKSWPLFGTRNSPGPNAERSIDPFRGLAIRKLITTSGASSTTVTSVNTDSPFELVAVGDLLVIQTEGLMYERLVTARASANSITVDASITIPTVGVGFTWKKAYFIADSSREEMWFSVANQGFLELTWAVNANANTGGVVTSLECTSQASGWPITAAIVEVATTTVASGSTSKVVESVDLRMVPFARCRFGLSFGTGDDADAAAEDIDVAVSLRR